MTSPGGHIVPGVVAERSNERKGRSTGSGRLLDSSAHLLLSNARPGAAAERRCAGGLQSAAISSSSSSSFITCQLMNLYCAVVCALSCFLCTRMCMYIYTRLCRIARELSRILLAISSVSSVSLYLFVLWASS